MGVWSPFPPKLLHWGEALDSSGAHRGELEAQPCGSELQPAQGCDKVRTPLLQESTKPKRLAQIWCVSFCSPGCDSMPEESKSREEGLVLFFIPSSWFEGTSPWEDVL